MWPPPFFFPLDAKVRYQPYYRPRDWSSPFHPLPWRIVARDVRQTPLALLGRYTIEPWELTGVWMRDRPLVVNDTQVSLWVDSEECCPQDDLDNHDGKENPDAEDTHGDTAPQGHDDDRQPME